VNTRQQSPLAPLLAVSLGREAAAHREAFGLERGERGIDRAAREAERVGE